MAFFSHHNALREAYKWRIIDTDMMPPVQDPNDVPVCAIKMTFKFYNMFTAKEKLRWRKETKDTPCVMRRGFSLLRLRFSIAVNMSREN